MTIDRTNEIGPSGSRRRVGWWIRWRPLVLKELRETLRDTRTIGTLFLMPLLVYPLLSMLLQNFIPRQESTDELVGFEIGFDSEQTFFLLREKLMVADDSLRKEEANFLAKRAQASRGPDSDQTRSEDKARDLQDLERWEPDRIPLERHHWPILEGPADHEELVRDGVFDVLLRLRPDESGQPDAEPWLELIYDPSREFSRAAAKFVALRLERYDLMQATTQLARNRQASGARLSRVPVAVTPAESSLVSFATLIPLILIMMTITGAVYPAIDLTAGERERGTLESLMASPVPRVGILAAKYVAVWVVAMLTASLNVISMLATLWVLRLDTLFLGPAGISLLVVVQIFGLLALFALFFASILLVITSAARSFKEAQAYLIPLMMVSLTPGALALMPDLQADLWLAFVPMVNLVLLSRDVMLSAVSGDFAWVAIVSTLLYSAAGLGLAAQVFGSDAVLYGSQGSWRELWQRPRGQQVPSPAFALLLLALMFPLQFLMLGVLGRLQEQATAGTMVTAIMTLTAVLFLGLPLLAVLVRGFAILPTFSLHAARPMHWVAGALLGLALWPWVGLSLWGLGQLRAWLWGTEASGWSDQVVQLAYQQLRGWEDLPQWSLVLALAVVPAVCEELFFRGLLLQSLRRSHSAWVAVLISGLAFGLFHFLVESSVAPLRFLVTSAMGMVLGWVCLRTGSVVPAILLHAFNNAILTSLALSRELWQETPPSGGLVAAVLIGCTLAGAAGMWILSRRPHATPLLASHSLAWWAVLAVGTSGAWANDAWAIGPRHASPSQPTAVHDTQSVFDERPLPRVAEGWQIRSLAGPTQVHDVHCLAVGPQDELFIAGPGYVAQLESGDRDGQSARLQPLAFRPQQAPQGLWVEADAVWVVVDRGIWRVPREGPAPTEPWLALPKTGGEHDFHAIRRGPDGYLYFLAGNYAGIDRSFLTVPQPIAQPRHGVLGRISPNGQLRQILVHGLRNAYGFDFGLDESFLIYDSDDERDAGLPWYQPTTLVAATEGTDVGWVSRCFKRPAGSLGSPRVLAETGRGSPTGVACQRTAAWGPAWFGAVAAADWTFGRVYLQPFDAADAHNGSAPLILVESRDQVAFAPTSLAFDSRGRLLIATGGRDTAGAIYCVERSPTEMPTESLPQQAALETLAEWFRQQTAPPASPSPSVENATKSLNDTISAKTKNAANASAAGQSAPGIPNSASAAAAPEHSGQPGQPDPTSPRELWEKLQKSSQDLERRLAAAQANGAATDRVSAWRLAGRRVLLKRWVERDVRPWVLPGELDQAVDFWLVEIRQWEPQLLPDAVQAIEIERAILGPAATGSNPPALNGNGPAKFVQALAPDRRLIIPLANFNNAQLLATWFPTAESEASAETGQTDDRVAIWSAAALAHRGQPHELSAEQFERLAALFASELDLSGNGQPTVLQWSDWLLIWRWALRSPIPSDSTTGPWDFMQTQVPREQALNKTAQAAITAAWERAWRQSLVPAVLSTASTPQATDDNSKPNRHFQIAEQHRQWLELQLLLGVAPETLASRWQLWFDSAAGRSIPPFTAIPAKSQAASPATPNSQPAGNHSATASVEDWHPVPRTWSMVLLAAMPQPWPEPAQVIAADYLLNVDRQQVRWNITTDRNWQQRFQDLSKLLCLDNPQLTQRLTESDQWQRPGQIPVLANLSAAQQQAAVEKLARHWGGWDPVAVETAQLDELYDLAQRWGLAAPRTSEAIALQQAVLQWVTQFKREQDERLKISGEPLGDVVLADLLAQLSRDVDWEAGDAERGRQLYQRYQCQVCHGRNGRLGPALSGVTRRFSREQIVSIILQPDSRVSDRYRPLLVQRTDGTQLVGRPIYDSTDGLLLEDSEGQVWQLGRADIEWSRPGTRSLMPSGLMREATAADWADLWAYLAEQ